MKQFIRYFRLPFGADMCVHTHGFWVRVRSTSLIVKYPKHPVYFSEREGYWKHHKVCGFRIGINKED